VCICRYKDAGGKSVETLEAVKHSKATLEAQLNTQRSLIENMRVELAGAKVTAHVPAAPKAAAWFPGLKQGCQEHGWAVCHVIDSCIVS
jgi:hypothetical protein